MNFENPDLDQIKKNLEYDMSLTRCEIFRMVRDPEHKAALAARWVKLVLPEHRYILQFIVPGSHSGPTAYYNRQHFYALTGGAARKD